MEEIVNAIMTLKESVDALVNFLKEKEDKAEQKLSDGMALIKNLIQLGQDAEEDEDADEEEYGIRVLDELKNYLG